jgi:colanic acid biosynthesis glycosyl transferase WcaI
MRILYLSQYFHPEVGATQTRAYEMAQGLVRAGHQVTMISEVPNHPAGIIPPEHRGRLYERANLDGIEVIRVWVKAAPVKTFRTRLAFYLSFMLNAIMAGLFLARRRYDIIYATSPPLFVGGAGLALSFLRRSPLVFEVRDLWPESAVALGELKNPRAIALAEQLERTCYRRACKIVLTAQEMLDHLAKRGISPSKMQVIRNGANPDLFHFDPKARRRIRRELALKTKFVVIYAGLIGLAQALTSALETADLIKTLDGDVHFLFFGDGPAKANLLVQAQQRQLANVTFLPAQPRELVPAYLSAADAALIPLVRERLIGALPSKMFDAMACERPILLSAEGEALLILREEQVGLSVPPETPELLCQAIIALKRDPAQARQYGNRGRQAVIERYSRQAQARQLERVLGTVVECQRGIS